VTLLLVGVMIGAACSAVVSTLLALAPDAPLRGMVFWLLGDLTRSDRFGSLLSLLVAATVLCVALGRPLNVLARGETLAATVGLEVRRLRTVVFVLSSLMTGLAVSTAGSIGFVGLVTPHLVRLALGNDQRVVLAGSALLGGLVLMAADLASRLVLAPRQLPVGALTAVVGVPIFLLLLSRHRS
jgi:iron complex transport system permease protein